MPYDYTTFKRTLCLSFAIVALALQGAGSIFAAQQPSGAQTGTDLKADEEKAIFYSIVEAIKTQKRKEAEAKSKADSSGETTAHKDARALVWRITGPYVLFLAEESQIPRRSFLAEVEDRRKDKQEGSGASNSGTTSLVSKGSVSSLLGLAVENGALTQTVSGTSITFRTNPTGIIKALAKKDYMDSGPNSDSDAVVKIVRKSSLAVTFDTNLGGQNGTFTGNRNQISGASFRYDLRNRRDPRDHAYLAAWEKLRSGPLTALANQLSYFADAVEANPKFNSWRDAAQTKIDSADENSVESAVLAIAEDFRRTFGDAAEIRSAVDRAAHAFNDYISAHGDLIDNINKSLIVTFEYTDTRQGMMTTAMASASAAPAMPGVKPPDLSNFKLIVAGGTVRGIQLTSNASVTLFNSNPHGPNKGRLRDLQLSGQVDVPLWQINNVGIPTLTFSGLFLSLQHEPLGEPITVNGVNVSTKGNIGLAQAKVTFPVKKGSGVNIPISFTYASRTELNKEHDVRGSIGLSFDLDSIFASVKP